MKMYTNYAVKKGWRVELEDAQETDLGGYRQVVLHISGKSVYGQVRIGCPSGSSVPQQKPKAAYIPLQQPWLFCLRLMRLILQLIPQIFASMSIAQVVPVASTSTKQNLLLYYPYPHRCCGYLPR